MNIGALKVELIDDWRAAWKKSSVLISAGLALAYAGLGELLPLISDHWMELSPFILKFFPTADQAVGPFVGALLTIAARLVKLSLTPKETT